MPSTEKASMRVTDLNQIMATAINQDIPYVIKIVPNTQYKQTQENSKKEPSLPPYDTTWLNQKYFNDKWRSLMLRSSIARILDVTDVNKYIMEKDLSAPIPFAQTVPTDTHLFGMLCMALDWLGVFKRSAKMENQFSQLKNMFPDLVIFKKYKDIEKIKTGWANAKSKMFKGHNICRLNYKGVIQELANKGQFVSECLLLDTLMAYLEPTIVNIINGR